MTDEEFTTLVDWTSTDAELSTRSSDNWTWDLCSCVTRKHGKSSIEILRCLPSIALADFHQYVREYFDKVRIQILVQGNMDQKQAIDITNNIVNRVKWSKIDDVSAKLIMFSYNR